MIWQDVMLDRWIDEAALRVAVAAAFEVPADTVAIVDTPEQLVATPPSARIILERDRQHREFPMQLLMILRDDELSRRFDGFDGVFRIAGNLAKQLGATVLFAEGPVSPSEWVRVRPTHDPDVVSLDIDETGDIDSFFVVAERELPLEWRASASPITHLTA